MTPEEAIQMARTWTKDFKEEGTDMPLWTMVKTLLDHCERQQQDIAELTLACQTLLRGNRRLQDELRGS